MAKGKSISKKIIKTNISQVNWCSIIDGKAEYKPAEIAFPNDNKYNFVSWFDSLLKGGLTIPEGKKPLTILLSGPPGSGKTTLALEICYKLAKNEGENDKPFSTFYISTDQESEALIANVKDLGYENVEKYFQPVSLKRKKLKIEKFQEEQGLIFVWGKDEIEKEWQKESKDKGKVIKIEDLTRMAFTVLSGWLLSNFIDEKAFQSFLKFVSLKLFSKKQKEDYVPQILVVDSLNIVTNQYKESFFEEFMGAVSYDTDIVIFVMDSSPYDNNHEIWEYACDMIIRLDYDSSRDYFLRSIEIIKARYQSHVWGKHQLKIYEDQDHTSIKFDLNKNNNNSEGRRAYNNILKRGHPFIRKGGIFIYPSIHYYLSRYKRHEYSDFSEIIDTKPTLKDTLRGLPKGRCTAFIGTRGGHKSHFGYLSCLNRIIENKDNAALIVSLRDDENTTIATLNKIIKIEFPERNLNDLNRYVDNDQLEILYFHPGFITPEEFFHRIFVSVQRLKKTGKDIIVLFNSLDQLKSRFPLCARQEIFVPGIIEFFSGEGVTSIFITVDEPGQPVEQYGLLPMADLILSFYPKLISAKDYLNHLKSEPLWMIDPAKTLEHTERIEQFKLLLADNPNLKLNIIALQVVRFAGGERAGSEGILELVDKEENLGLYPTKGLHFTKFDPAYDTGQLTHSKLF